MPVICSCILDKSLIDTLQCAKDGQTVLPICLLNVFVLNVFVLNVLVLNVFVLNVLVLNVLVLNVLVLNVLHVIVLCLCCAIYSSRAAQLGCY